MTRTTKTYAAILALFALTSGLGLVLIVNKLDPTANFTNQFLFFINLLVFSFAASVLFGFYLRLKLGQQEFLRQYFIISARQGLWFALLITLSFTFLALKLFNLWSALWLFLALVFLELFFQRKS